jgi:hypothetical protein
MMHGPACAGIQENAMKKAIYALAALAACAMMSAVQAQPDPPTAAATIVAATPSLTHAVDTKVTSPYLFTKYERAPTYGLSMPIAQPGAEGYQLAKFKKGNKAGKAAKKPAPKSSA